MKTEDLKELIKRSGWEISALGYIHAGTNAVTFNELQRIVDQVETRAMRFMLDSEYNRDTKLPPS